jgi:hypothetical protein
MNRAAPGIPSGLAHQSKFQNLTRVGFLARGILYITIAVLAVRTGRSEDMNGALQVIAEGAGAWLLGLMAAGMTAYGLWRLADAAFGIENPGSDGKAYAKRAAALFIGAVYLSLAYTAARLMSSGGSGGSGGQGSMLPTNSLVVGAAALIMLIAGGSQLLTAYKASFLKKLDTPPHADWIKRLGQAGYTARGLVFISLAYLLGRAAMRGGSSNVGGTEQALDMFSGPAWTAIAVGLGLFGVFSIIEARYRRIRRPPVG